MLATPATAGASQAVRGDEGVISNRCHLLSEAALLYVVGREMRRKGCCKAIRACGDGARLERRCGHGDGDLAGRLRAPHHLQEARGASGTAAG